MIVYIKHHQLYLFLFFPPGGVVDVAWQIVAKSRRRTPQSFSAQAGRASCHVNAVCAGMLRGAQEVQAVLRAAGHAEETVLTVAQVCARDVCAGRRRN